MKKKLGLHGKKCASRRTSADGASHDFLVESIRSLASEVLVAVGL
jgi:hypothetical protein